LKEEPETKFLIAGDGAEKETLERQAEGLNINSSVEFLGRMPHEEMPNLLSQADIYVSTSLHDGTSVSLLEAMASGAFPIVTDIPSNREWIRNAENGFLISTGNENVLAMKIVEAIRNKELVLEATNKNQKIIEEKAHWKENIKKIVNIYESESMTG
jgi:glycosyltransferase involved in cell wall biosynthesis